MKNTHFKGHTATIKVVVSIMFIVFFASLVSAVSIVDTDVVYNSIGSSSDSQGVEFQMNANYILTKVILNSSVTATKVQLLNSLKVNIANGTVVGGNASFNYNLIAGQNYTLVADSSGASYTYSQKLGPPFPNVKTELNWTRGLAGDGNFYNYSWNIQAVELAVGGTESINPTSPSNASTISDSGANFTANFNITNLEGYNYTWSNATYQLWNSTHLFNSTTVTISGNNTIDTLFIDSFTLEDYTWNVLGWFGNATFSNYTTSSNYTFSVVPFSTISEVYNNYTTEGSTDLFSANISLQTGQRISTISFVYNGTIYPTSYLEYTTDKYYLYRNHIIPRVTATTNYTFYWSVTLESGSVQNTTAHAQEVSDVAINSTCGAGMFLLYNLTMVDERNQLKLNGVSNNTVIKADIDLYNLARTEVISEYYGEFSQTNPAAICINGNLSNGEKYSLDAQFQYGATNYSSEFYNIERYIINATSIAQNITLYDLDTDNTQKFTLLARDSSYLPIDGALIQVERKYIENGTFYITEIPKTNEGGITSASLETEDVIYNFKIYQDGVLVSTFTNVLAICQTPLVSQCEIDFNAFQTGISIPDYQEGDDFNFTLGYNSSSRTVSSQFVIPSGTAALVELKVISEDTLGTSVCTDSLTAVSGTLSCLVPSAFGNSTVMAVLYKDGVEQGRGNIKLDQTSSDIFGVILIILSIMVFMTLLGVGISDNPVITGVFLFVGVVLLFALNLVSNTGFIGAGATILFLAIAIILVIIKAARRN